MKPCSAACSSRATASATRRDSVVVRRRREHEDLAGGVGADVVDRRDRAGRRGARRALGGGEQPHAPVVLGRREVVRAHDDDRRAALELDAELGGARDDVAAVGHAPVQHGAQERLLRGLGRALGRAHALDLGGDQRRDEAQQRRCGLAGAAAQAQPADDGVADPQLVRLDAGRVRHQRALVGRGARRDGEDGAGAVDQDERGVERAGGRADDLGQSVARLHRVGDRPERREVHRGLGFLTRRRHRG